VSTNQITIIPLTNATVLPNQLAPAGPALTNFYSFAVVGGPTNVQFIVSNIVGGNLDLLSRLGALPTPGEMTAGSFNTGLLPQVVTVVTSADFPSLNGTWYLGVPNNQPGGVSFSIYAATNIPAAFSSPAVVFAALSAPSLTNGFTMSWQSALGGSYEVDLTTNLANWTKATNFTATKTVSTYTDQTPIGTQDARFYRVYRTH